jgi:predicted ThiF/HesA family dinucleotide-utilizing enzyme
MSRLLLIRLYQQSCIEAEAGRLMWGKKKLICFWKETVKFLENIKKEHGKNHSETKRKIIKIMKLNHYSKRRRGKRENLDKIHL